MSGRTDPGVRTAGAVLLAAVLALPLACGGEGPPPRLEVAEGGEGDSWWAR